MSCSVGEEGIRKNWIFLFRPVYEKSKNFFTASGFMCHGELIFTELKGML